MKLVHAGSGAVVATSIERAETVRARMKGLLGRKGLGEGCALVIEPCTSIHTFFMRFAIDVLFLSREGRVIRAIANLPPWRATRLYPSAALVVELPAHALERAGVREGDFLRFV